MNLVWPAVGLAGGPLVAVFYLIHGRAAGPAGHKPSFIVQAAKATLHCGAGCTLGDIAAELLGLSSPAVLVALRWHSLFPDRIYASWVLDYLFAFALGIAFQFFTIAPMRGLGVGRGLVEALKADTLSLSAWQVGMYGVMALVQFRLAPAIVGQLLTADTAGFWFAMQFAMLAGFAVSLPVNAWLLRKGVKEPM